MVSGFSIEDILSKNEHRRQHRTAYMTYMPHGRKLPKCCMRYHPTNKLLSQGSPRATCQAIDDDDDKVTRRPRTSITLCQREFLEGEFQNERYPTLAYIDKLSRRIKLPQYVIKVWFQNRRAKYRKEGHRRKPTKVEQISPKEDKTDLQLTPNMTSLPWTRELEYTNSCLSSPTRHYSTTPTYHDEELRYYDNRSRLCDCSKCMEGSSYTRY